MDKPKLDRRSRSILYFIGIVALSVIGLILEYYQNGLTLEATQVPLLLQSVVVIVNGMVVFSLCLDIFGDPNFISDQEAVLLPTLALVVWVTLTLLLGPLIEFAIALQIVIGFILFLMGFYQRLYHVLAPAITFVVSGIAIALGLLNVLAWTSAVVFTLFAPIFILLSDIVTTLEKYQMGNLDVRGRLVGLALLLGLLPPLAIVLVIQFRDVWSKEPMPPPPSVFDIRNFFPDAQWKKRFAVACGVGVLVFIGALVIFL